MKANILARLNISIVNQTSDKFDHFRDRYFTAAKRRNNSIKRGKMNNLICSVRCYLKPYITSYCEDTETKIFLCVHAISYSVSFHTVPMGIPFCRYVLRQDHSSTVSIRPDWLIYKTCDWWTVFGILLTRHLGRASNYILCWNSLSCCDWLGIGIKYSIALRHWEEKRIPRK